MNFRKNSKRPLTPTLIFGKLYRSFGADCVLHDSNAMFQWARNHLQHPQLSIVMAVQEFAEWQNGGQFFRAIIALHMFHIVCLEHKWRRSELFVCVRVWEPGKRLICGWCVL